MMNVGDLAAVPIGVIHEEIVIAKAAGLSLRLSDNRIEKSCFDEVAGRAINDGAMIVNPKAVSREDVIRILNDAF